MLLSGHGRKRNLPGTANPDIRKIGTGLNNVVAQCHKPFSGEVVVADGLMAL